MLFLIYWELNEDMSVAERIAIAQKLTESGFPPENVEIIRWDSTPDSWGVTLLEANSAEDVFRALNMWRTAAPGFFKYTRTAPALPAQEAIPLTGEILQSLGSS